MLRNQNNMMSSLAAPAVHQNISLSVPDRCTNTKTYYAWIRSPLLGVFGRRKRTVRYLREPDSRLTPREQEKYGVISESHETSVWFRLLGYGCHWSQQYPYGSILPSLRFYPVIKHFSAEHLTLIEQGCIQEIQQAFEHGTLHPLTVDSYGRTVLHV